MEPGWSIDVYNIAAANYAARSQDEPDQSNVELIKICNEG